MWLATLNPGPSRSRGRRKRRTLSAWQRKVKKYGGVMQAVKAMRAEKAGRKRRKAGRRRARRNPFLTTALTSGGARILMNAGRRKRRRSKIRSRRSAVSGRSRSGRSRRAAARRSKMARKTRRRHRRTPPRGRGGRFKSRSSHRRRHRRVRRNPVLPISWNPSRRRRRRTRRNPLFLSRKGFSARKHKGYRQLHRRRHSPRYWHNNPRRRRRYRNNPVLPISWNPAGVLSRGGPVGEVLGRVKSFVDVGFWTETGVPAAVGFFGSKAVGNFIYNNIPNVVLTTVPQAQPYIRILSDALGGAGLAYLTGRFMGKKQGDAMWLGTVVNVAYSLLKNLLGGTSIASTIGLDGLGDDLADRMRSEIARRVQASISGGRLNGVGSYLRTTNVDGRLSEYVTEGALRSSPNYSPGNALGDENLDGGGF